VVAIVFIRSEVILPNKALKLYHILSYHPKQSYYHIFIMIGQDVLNTQHESLDATDAYASAWTTALAEAQSNNSNNDVPIKVSWGGRGKGGRGTARRTFQPFDIVVDVSPFFVCYFLLLSDVLL